jgi:hypothetical protein
MCVTRRLLPLWNAIGVATVAAAMLFGASAPATYAATTTVTDRVVLDPGTVIPVTLNNELTSNGSIAGDTFTATVDTSREAYNNIMEGATVGGFIRSVTPREGNNPGTIDLAFTSLRLANGQSYDISGSPTSLDAKNLEVTNGGMLRAKNTRSDQRLKYAGIGAGAGALIRILGGDKLRIEDVLLGGLLGYGVGSIIKTPDQVHDVDLKPGMEMGVVLNKPVRYYHRTSTSTGSFNDGTVSSNHPIKYYWFNGQRWGKDLVTGERFMIPGGTRQVFHRTGRKYYMFQGHHFFLDLNTGERVQLD